MIEVIGLSGKAGSGKDWVFEHHLKPLGYHRFALADHFKIAAIGRGLATYEEVFFTKPPHVRAALQRIGTEEGRLTFHEDVWCDTVRAWMHHISHQWGISKFCIPDIRFPNEVKFVQRYDGFVMRLDAPNRVLLNGMASDARLHPSETALDDFMDFDWHLANDFGDEAGLARGVHSALAYFDLISTGSKAA